jgi:transposase
MADAMLADDARPVTGGVDTHKHEHVAAVVDHVGGEPRTQSFPNTGAGHAALLAWLQGHGPLGRVGIEGTGSYGVGLMRHLTAAGVAVVEINRPNRQARRRHGKSDPLDAVAAARATLAGTDAGTPKTANGIVESIRMLRLVRRSATGMRTQTMNQLRAVIDTGPEPLRQQLLGLSTRRLITAASALDPADASLRDPDHAAAWTARALAVRWQALTEQIDQSTGELARLVPIAAPNLCQLVGLGIDTAAALLIAAGDNPHRLHNEAAFAALCGTNPVPASSGRIRRHRLNRAGNRDANNALWRIAIVRMSHDPRTRDYVTRRTAEGLSKREIIRCLKRYIARETYPHLLADLQR